MFYYHKDKNRWISHDRAAGVWRPLLSTVLLPRLALVFNCCGHYWIRHGCDPVRRAFFRHMSCPFHKSLLSAMSAIAGQTVSARDIWSISDGKWIYGDEELLLTPLPNLNLSLMQLPRL